MIKPFQFEDGGRTYNCMVEESRTSPSSAAGTTSWWWFEVSSDQQRYAPFVASPGDTRESVRTRIIAFYNYRLERKNAPPEPRGHRFGGGRPPSPKPPVADIAEA